MKTGVLGLVPVAAVDDSSSMLTIGTQSSVTASLLEAVAHRNATSMQAMVQELAEQSLNGDENFLDADVREAIKNIKHMFVKSIQQMLEDEHRADQEHLNCFTKDCFRGCIDTYDKTMLECKGNAAKCISEKAEEHKQCRLDLLNTYSDMAVECGKLHCFEMSANVKELSETRGDLNECVVPKCECDSVDECHQKADIDADKTCDAVYARDSELSFTHTKCGTADDKTYGDWLSDLSAHYLAKHTEWTRLRKTCAEKYQKFLEDDSACDEKQKAFEGCMCNAHECEEDACKLDYDNCERGCWETYKTLVDSKQCLEKDRKIDWTATKKIECYVDVLLKDFTKDELKEKCGSEDCFNTARQMEYKACEEVCPNIDYDGHWPEVDATSLDGTDGGPPDGVTVMGHERRTKQKIEVNGEEVDSPYLLGDGIFKCDTNGHATVFTQHRGGVQRQAEARCTEHLDIDYQVPECKACDPLPEPEVCDAAFLKLHYGDFDKTDTENVYTASCTGDVVPAECDFAAGTLTSSLDGVEKETISFEEHSTAWAYNRCECTRCQRVRVKYGPRQVGQCGFGAHTLDSKSPDRHFKGPEGELCVSAKGDKSAIVPVEEDMCVKRIIFTHTDGHVSCWGRTEGGESNWGCGDDVGIVLADEHRRVVAPVFDTTVGMTPNFAWDWSKNGHWYRMDGIQSDSPSMAWTFNQPYLFSHKENYKLWYNEDMAQLSEADNHGEACYNMKFELADASSCHELAPLQFHKVCVSGASKSHATIDIPTDTCVSEIAIHHLQGKVNCPESSHQSHFGCGDNMVGLVWTKQGCKEIVMPKEGQVQGVRETRPIDAGISDSDQYDPDAHWYLMESRGSGTGLDINNKRTLRMRLNHPEKMSGSFDLWYNEDLTKRGVNAGGDKACYDIAVHRAKTC